MPLKLFWPTAVTNKHKKRQKNKMEIYQPHINALEPCVLVLCLAKYKPWSHLVSFGIILDHLGSFEINWVVVKFLESLWTVWAHLESSKLIRGHLGTPEIVWNHLRASGIISDPLGSPGVIWAHLGSHGIIRDHLIPSEIS